MAEMMKGSAKNMIRQGIQTSTQSTDSYKDNREAVSAGLRKLKISDLGKDEKARLVLEMFERIGAESEMMPSIGPIKGKILTKIILQHKPVEILEIGTLFGYSAILMAIALPPNGHVSTIERNSKNAGIAQKAIKLSGLQGKITIEKGEAIEIIPKLKKFDLVLIDGRKDQYLQYIKLLEPHISKGGVVIADNMGVFKNYTKDYLKYMQTSGKFRNRMIKTKFEFTDDINDALEVSVKIK